MKFEAVKNPERIAALKDEVGRAWQQRHDARGSLVAHSMPSLPDLCPKLRAIIFGSAHREQYMGIFYYLESRDGHIRQLTPATEYYVGAFGAMADDRFSLSVASSRIAAIMQATQIQWRGTREEYGPNRQPQFAVAGHIYQLKTEVAAALFFARGLLDIFATLSHFLYGPNSRVFSSFADWVKHLSKPRDTEPVDPIMRAYCQDQMNWFWYLRDFRDYVTHHSSLRVYFYERNESLETYLQHLVKPQELLNELENGIDSFLHFADDHFAARFERGH